MSSPAGASGSTAHSRQSATPPAATNSARPPPTTASTNLPGTAPKATKQTSSASLNPRAMGPAKSFESTRSRGSKDSLNSRNGKSSATPPPPSASDEQLKTLRGEFDSLRSIVTCKICYGLLYEPYTTSCGHTYCYACFCKSFQPNAVPSCPECRGRLVNAPAPAFMVREITAAFLKRPELLPQGETLEQHKGWQKEHADIIQADKNNKDARHGGLWRGVFKRKVRRMRPLVDEEDGVTRCPYCGWELEEGSCNRCGLPFDENGTGDWEFSDLEMASDNGFMGGHDLVFEEYDMEDDFDEGAPEDWEEHDDDEHDEDPLNYHHLFGIGGPYDQPFSIQRMLGGRRNNPTSVRRVAAHSTAGSRSRYSASVQGSEMGTLEEEDEDEDSSMSGFIERDDAPIGYSRESTTSMSRSSSAFPESIAEGDEDEEDDLPINPIRRRPQTSTSAATTGPQHRPHPRPNMPLSQAMRRRRVISETPSSTSASTTPAEDEEVDEEDQGPIPSRRRRRGTSSGEPVRRVRPRAGSNSISEETGESETWGYRPLGTPQIGDGEDEQSDGGRTAVGWEPITTPNERIRNTGSLTPTADRPQAPPRPASRTNSSRFPLGSRGIRRRSSVQSISTVRYEDNDADDDTSDTQQPEDVSARNILRSRSSRVALRNTTPQPIHGSMLQQAQNFGNEDDFDSDDTEPSPLQTNRGQVPRRRPEYNPHVSLMLAQIQTEIQATEVERPYPEFEHLRGLSRTPLARPRTSNRNRGTVTPQGVSNQPPIMSSPGYASRNPQTVYNPTRFRSVVEAAPVAMNISNQTARTGFQSSPRTAVNDPAPTANTSRSRNTADLPSPTMGSHSTEQYANSPRTSWDERVAARNVAAMRGGNGIPAGPPAAPSSNLRSQTQVSPSMYASPGPMPRLGEVIERPVSRVNYRAAAAINRPPSVVNRPPSVVNRPPSASSRRGSLTRSAFAPPPMGPAGVGLNTARAWHPNNPFFNAAHLRPRPSSQRLGHEPSVQTLRRPSSIRVLRNQPQQPPSPEADPDSPQMRPQASRLHLRPQPSYRRLQAQRDAPMGIPQQNNYARAQRDSIMGIAPQPSTLSRPQLQRDTTTAVPQQTSSPSGQRYSPRGASTLSEDERSRRATELIRRRGEELAQLTTQQQAAAREVLQLSSQQQAAAREVLQQRLASIGRATQAATIAPTNITAASMNTQGDTLERSRSNRALASPGIAVSSPTSSATLQNSPAVQARARNAPTATPEARMPTMAPAVTPLTTGGDRRRN